MALFLLISPLIAACFFGLGYTLTERTQGLINLTSYVFLNGVANIILAIIVSLSKGGQNLSFGFTNYDLTSFLMVCGAFTASALGWLFTIYAVQNISASYTAFAELSYPLWTILFLYLFFGVKQYDWHIITGGVLVLIGTLILVYGQYKKEIF